MFDLFTATRMLVDYLWEIKVLSALHLLLFAGAWFVAVMNGRPAHWKTTIEDWLLLTLACVLVLAYSRSISEETTIIFGKLLSFIFAFWIGRLMYIQGETMRLTRLLSVIGLTCITIASILGIGFQTWGGARTLSAGYFFKTDLALSAALALSVILVFSESKLLKTCTLALAGWIVFKANARIFIAIFALLPLVYGLYLTKARKAGALFRVLIAAGLAVGATVIFFIALPSFVGDNYLGFNLSEGFSDANSQGRSVIWAGALQAYRNSDYLSQWLGAGFDADKRYIAYVTGLRVEQYSAHSSPLYLLITSGIVGVVLYATTVLLVTRKAIIGLRVEQDNRFEQLFILLLLIYISCGLTTDAVIRPQIMMPLWLFSGVVVRRAQVRRAVARHARTVYLRTATQHLTR